MKTRRKTKTQDCKFVEGKCSTSMSLQASSVVLQRFPSTRGAPTAAASAEELDSMGGHPTKRWLKRLPKHPFVPKQKQDLAEELLKLVMLKFKEARYDMRRVPRKIHDLLHLLLSPTYQKNHKETKKSKNAGKKWLPHSKGWHPQWSLRCKFWTVKVTFVCHGPFEQVEM